jgi:hypothetical protein
MENQHITSNRFKNFMNSIGVLLVAMLFLPSFSLNAQSYIADYRVAKESVLRSIPVEYINKAKAELVVAYQHTSHGTHVSRGMFGLQGYKEGDDVLFGLSRTPAANRLEFRDFAMEDYAPPGVEGVDLSRDETAFIQTTRNYLDAPENATVNVVMWAWSLIAGHDVAGNYLPGMDSLINEYGPGGSKIGSGEGQREVPVTFVYMTGHSVKNSNTGPLNPKEQSELIINHCETHQHFCHDYYTIDTHTMEDTYYEDTGDNGDSDTYGGNFYEDWQNSHTLGVDWYENWHTPEGHVSFGVHTTQHITSNRKAYAMWWILARIAGWDGGTSSAGPSGSRDDFLIYPNPGKGTFRFEAPQANVNEIRVIDSLGKIIVFETPPEPNLSEFQMDLRGISSGVYIVQLTGTERRVYSSTLVIH